MGDFRVGLGGHGESEVNGAAASKMTEVLVGSVSRKDPVDDGGRCS